MKITKYLFVLGGLGAILFWAAGSGCTNKQVACKTDSTFASASTVLVTECNKCHGDKIAAEKFAKGIVFNSSDSNAVLNFTADPTQNLPDIGSYGLIVQDIEGIAPLHVMPLGGIKLSECEINAVKSWIWFHYTH